MSPRPFLAWPDKRLQSAAAPVGEITDESRALWDEMAEAMYAMPGVGLAAPQLGVMQQLAVVDCSNGAGKLIRLADPEILHASAQMRDHDEASPNLPGVSAKVSRPRAVTVAFTNDRGARITEDFVGLWATSVQHQIDHLNGRMYFDRLSPVKRKMLLARAAKLRKRR